MAIKPFLSLPNEECSLLSFVDCFTHNITSQFLLNNLTDMRGKRDEEFVNTHITLIKGYFNQTLLNYPGKQIALLHIDCDLCEGYLTVLETFYHRVVNGGLILFDVTCPLDF